MKLHYYHNYDSLVWAGTFGEDVLVSPTAIAYADYGGHDRTDHDIYVTDPGQFESPVDIYIDKRGDPNEMVICEWWDEFSGIQCFTVSRIYGKKAVRNNALPATFELYANYPNPFNSSTTINFDLPVSSRVTIDIYNILGQQVVRLADKPYQSGHHQINWDASSVASGVYFYRLTAGDNVFVKKMLLLK